MAGSIGIKITGVEIVATRFDTLDKQMRLALRIAVDKLGAGFIDYLRANKLSGNPLQSRTGALAASFRHTVNDYPGGVVANITTNSPYARYHEYGFHGTENVRAHTRLGHPVRAFTRTVNYAGRPYIRPAINEFEPRVFAEIDAAIKEALK